MGRTTGKNNKDLGVLQLLQGLGGTLASAGRGVASATAGLPGDIESLIRLFAGGQNIMPTTEDVSNALPQLPKALQQPTVEELAHNMPLTPGQVQKLAKPALLLGAEGIARAAASESPLMRAAVVGAQPSYVIKNKGGNWLNGSVENAVKNIKTPVSPTLREDMALTGYPVDEEALRRIYALNDWIDGPLTKYLKTSLGTPEDPVRALAEQGILHYEPGRLGNMARKSNELLRQDIGFPAEGMGQSDLAKAWEGFADNIITPRKASDFQPPKIQQVDTFGGDPVYGSADRSILIHRASPEFPYKVEIPGGQRLDSSKTLEGAIANVNAFHNRAVPEIVENPWINKLDPDTRVHSLGEPYYTSRDLGLGHLTDELANALNPESGLPRNLLLNSEDMKQMGIDRAVRHVANINDWRAAQKVVLDRMKANNSATVLHKEYPENNPNDLRWVELKSPKDLPEGFELITDTSSPGMPFYQYKTPQGGMMQGAYTQEEALKNAKDAYARKVLGESLKYEGDTMGHCVGGYCDDVVSGKSRIFSLRNAKGEPHVTIETRPVNVREYYNYMPHEQRHKLLDDAMKWYNSTNEVPYADSPMERAELLQAYLNNQGVAIPENIVQIKGKQNLKPKDEYLPFVQDFIKSGKWGDIGDLQNSGLRRSSDVWNEMERKKITEAGHEIPEYVTDADIDPINKAVWPDVWNNLHLPDNYANGGLITNYGN